MPDAGAGGATLSDVIAVLAAVVLFSWTLGVLVIAVVEWWARWRWRR